jgi:hypothetical protein
MWLFCAAVCFPFAVTLTQEGIDIRCIQEETIRQVIPLEKRVDILISPSASI